MASEEGGDIGERTPLLTGQCDNIADRHVTCQRVTARHVLCFLGFLGMLAQYIQQNSFSVDLVAMINSKSSSAVNMTSTSSENKTSLTERADGEFDWDEHTQGLILGCFYYGLTCMQLGAGWLSDRVGGKRVFGYGMLCFSVLTTITPWVARAGVPHLVTLRVVQGVAGASTKPALHAMLGTWSPKYERSRLTGFALTGSKVGTVVGMVGSGLLCQNGFAGGWPSAFYVSGTCGCVWVILWLALVHDSPAQHPRITAAERKYIEATVEPPPEKVTTPWRHMLTSPAVWAITVARFSGNWGFSALVALLPIYMHDILHFDIQQNGVLSSLPFLLLSVTEMAGCAVADFLMIRGYLSTQNTRKVMNTAGCVLPAVFLVAVSYVDDSPSLAVVLLTIGVGVCGFCVPGFVVNHLDIAPRHAGTVYGLTCVFGLMPGFVAPSILAALTQHGHIIEQWRIFFFISVAVFLAGAIVFGLLAKGEQLWWAAESPTFSHTKQDSKSDTASIVLTLEEAN